MLASDLGLRIAVLLAALAVSAPALADGVDAPTDPVAREHFEVGQGLYNQEEFDGAIAEWEKGYAIERAPVFEFWMANAHRLMDRCVEARGLYKRFLASNPPAEDEELAADGILACQTDPEGAALQPAPAPASGGASGAAPVVSEPADLPPVRDSGGGIWYRDVTGDVLVGAGVVSLAVGVGFTVAAASSRASARDAVNLEEFRRHDDSLRRRRLIALVGTVAGAGLVGAGLYRWLTASERRDAMTVATWLAPGSAGLGVAGRF